MKILHTSDWHLGRMLYGQKRYAEFSQFLQWLLCVIETERVDALLVSGDVFDTTTPSNLAQQLYYNFLSRIATSCCRTTVIIGGNHDSPTFLQAPKALLHAFNVHVIGAKTDNLEDEVIVLYNGTEPKAIVCAVPYLRDRDIRTVAPGETLDDKNTKLVAGLQDHYGQVCALASEKRATLAKEGYTNLPLIAMGHLFTAGGKTVEGDGVRDLYVGSLSHVGGDMFPDAIEYLALGHLHVPQIVAGNDHMRYSGSPIPMGFGEANQNKKVILVEFGSTKPKITEIKVPCFQQLVRITGSLDEIQTKIAQLKREESQAWLEIEYTGTEIRGNLRDLLEESVVGSQMEITIIKNKRTNDLVLKTINENETLEELAINEVFMRCLDEAEVPEEGRQELTASYHEIVRSLQEEDLQAE